MDLSTIEKKLDQSEYTDREKVSGTLFVYFQLNTIVLNRPSLLLYRPSLLFYWPSLLFIRLNIEYPYTIQIWHLVDVSSCIFGRHVDISWITFGVLLKSYCVNGKIIILFFSSCCWNNRNIKEILPWYFCFHGVLISIIMLLMFLFWIIRLKDFQFQFSSFNLKLQQLILNTTYHYITLQRIT